MQLAYESRSLACRKHNFAVTKGRLVIQVGIRPFKNRGRNAGLGGRKESVQCRKKVKRKSCRHHGLKDETESGQKKIRKEFK